MSEHQITAVEPAWTEAKYSPDSDGAPSYVGDSQRILHSDGLDELFNEAEYNCSCGAEFANWQEVEDHFEQVTTDD